MAEARTRAPALLVVAITSRHDEVLAWARDRLESEYGPLALAGFPFAFSQTAYYERTMGTGLRKQLVAFESLIDQGSLADVKLCTNALERELAESGTYPEQRPVNLDPGYLTEGKFVLASMKDHCHRIYLRDGVFAEVTLHYRQSRGGGFEPWPMTYNDYKLPVVNAFLLRARAYYRDRLAQP